MRPFCVFTQQHLKTKGGSYPLKRSAMGNRKTPGDISCFQLTPSLLELTLLKLLLPIAREQERPTVYSHHIPCHVYTARVPGIIITAGNQRNPAFYP